MRLEPRAGHTASDVTVEIDDPSVVFFGDLLWNGMFPNFRDTSPSLFAESIRAATRARETVYIPGHGSLAGRADRLFTLPESLGRWTMLGDNYFDVAFSAWHNDLSAAK